MFIKFSGKLVDFQNVTVYSYEKGGQFLVRINHNITENWWEEEEFPSAELRDQRFAHLEEILCRQNIDSIVQAINNTICIR